MVSSQVRGQLLETDNVPSQLLDGPAVDASEIDKPVVLGRVKAVGKTHHGIVPRWPVRIHRIGRNILHVGLPRQALFLKLIGQAASRKAVVGIARLMRIVASPGLAAGAAIPGIIVVDAERVTAEHSDIGTLARVKLTVELRRLAISAVSRCSTGVQFGWFMIKSKFLFSAMITKMC
jgi:hypothetical protein